jgi:hypothetical protein
MRPTRMLHPTLLATLVIAGAGLSTAASGVEVASQLHQAAVSRAVSKSVAWKVGPANAGGTVDGTGLYTAPTAQQGTYTIVASNVADLTRSGSAHAASPPGSIDPSAFLPADRATVWNAGMMGVGGIPARSTVCACQGAINVCPAGRVVQLTAGTFIINSGNFLLINKGITLRGAGPGQTTRAKTSGAKPFQEAVSAKPSPLIIVGPSRYNNGVVGSTDLTADAAKGA